jgi:hypothetical protein
MESTLRKELMIPKPWGFGNREGKISRFPKPHGFRKTTLESESPLDIEALKTYLAWPCLHWYKCHVSQAWMDQDSGAEELVETRIQDLKTVLSEKDLSKLNTSDWCRRGSSPNSNPNGPAIVKKKSLHFYMTRCTNEYKSSSPAQKTIYMGPVPGHQ